MKRKWIYTLGIIAFFYFNGGVEAQNPEITSKELKQHVNYLAADELEGRKAGTSGGEKAAEYIRGQFKNYGLDLMAENGFQHFELINSAEAGKNNLLKIDGEKATPKKDFVPISFSANKSLTADVVFAGYGFQFDKDTLQWNDYKGIDAKGKWVMMFRGDPQPDNPHSPYAMQAMPRSKIVTAEDNNAGGVLFVTPVGMNEKDQLPRIFYDKTATKADIPVLTITRALADKILSGTNKSISGLENKLTE
ncbi:MAG: hypothetical protein K9I47_09010, partial [Bacteroidales bacterium]|nr:hypothetical protein [Bacteroidales bacterium]